ncbi:MAG: RluA family pseudouridine synthase, partial [Bacillota bacterium]
TRSPVKSTPLPTLCSYVPISRLMPTDRTFTVSSELAGQTLAAALRQLVGELSWGQAKRLITTRRVEINDTLCLNDARRLNAGDVVRVLENPRPPVPRETSVRILHIDTDLLIIDKPAGVITLRRDEESGFSEERKELQPSLDELLQNLLSAPATPVARRRGRKPKPAGRGPKLFAVHRLDRDTSGLMIFALSVRAQEALIRMLSKHQVRRNYIAVVHGHVEHEHTVESWLIRDRGDGLRGSAPLGPDASDAKHAITHVRPIESIGNAYTVVECRLETGRTHQIRIHMTETGHMLCGEKLYTRRAPGAPATPDSSGAPRQALHSTEISLIHPFTAQTLHFTLPMPKDLANWLDRLRSECEASG